MKSQDGVLLQGEVGNVTFRRVLHPVDTIYQVPGSPFEGNVRSFTVQDGRVRFTSQQGRTPIPYVFQRRREPIDSTRVGLSFVRHRNQRVYHVAATSLVPHPLHAVHREEGRRAISFVNPDRRARLISPGGDLRDLYEDPRVQEYRLSPDRGLSVLAVCVRDHAVVLADNVVQQRRSGGREGYGISKVKEEVEPP